MEKRARSKWNIVAGLAALCAAAAAILFFFGGVSSPGFEEVVLFPTMESRNETAWNYYDQYGNAAAEAYNTDGYLEGVENAAGNAVAAERIMTEPLENAVLKFQYMGQQVSVYLDGTLLYSDIPGTPEEGIAFLPPDGDAFERKRDEFQTQYAVLPEDYLGKTLTVITYFPDGEVTIPVYPTLQNDATVAAYPVTDSAKPLALGGAFAAAALLLLVLLVYGAFSGIAEWPVALLAAFFLCAMVGRIYLSSAAYYSIGSSMAGYLVSVLYIDLLFLFFSCYMRKSLRIAMACAVVFHIAAEGIRAARNALAGQFYETGGDGWIAFFILMLFVVFCIMEWRAKKSFFPTLGKCILAFGAGYAALLAGSFFLAPGSAFTTELWLPFSSLTFGRAVGFNQLFSVYLAVAGLVIVFLAFIRRNIYIRTERNMLALKNEAILETMQAMEAAMRQSDEQRHEIKHHIAALQILLQTGQQDKAENYLSELASAVDASGAQRYTENILIDAILKDEAGKAAQGNIEIEAEVAVPRELSVTDHDMCSLLYNMLDNAIRACAALPEGKRKIRLKLQKKGNFLAVLCQNPRNGMVRTDREGNIETSHTDGAGHGYGIPIMRKICEKYHSVLLVEFDGDMFTVKTNLRLPD